MISRDNRTSIIARQLSDPLSIENHFMQSNENLPVSCSDENLFCIWYHDDDLGENIQNEMKKRLKELFSYIRIFDDPCEFAAYLICPRLIVQKIFFIITSKLAEYLCIIAMKRPQYEKVYQFQSTSSVVNHSLVFTDINQLIEQISKDIRAYLDKNQSPSVTEPSSTGCRRFIAPPPWSVWNSKKTENSFRYCKKESPEFFLFQILTRILTQMKCDRDQSLAEMIKECRHYYINDPVELKKIEDVAKNYRNKSPIWFYTNDSFLFRLLGRAFRSEDFECMFKFRRYIFDLHQELDKLIAKQETLQNILRLYRGKKLHTTAIQQLQDNTKGFMSMNGFLSTTYDREIALKVFAGAGQDRPNYESVLFEFCIDEETIKRAYADIVGFSKYPEEKEVLFTIGSIWEIDSVEKYNDLYWIVKLLSCNDISLRIIQFYEEFADDLTFHMVGDVLRELGQNTKAEKFYHKMLNDPTIKDETRLTLYYNIAMINMEQGKDDEALKFLHQAEDMIPSRMIDTQILAFQSLYAHSNSPSSIRILNNMGVLYEKNDESEKALQYFNKALDVEKSDQKERATVYGNIGLLYYGQGNYENAVTYLSTAVNLAEDDPSLTKFKEHYDAVNQYLLSRNNSSAEKPDDSH